MFVNRGPTTFWNKEKNTTSDSIQPVPGLLDQFYQRSIWTLVIDDRVKGTIETIERYNVEIAQSLLHTGIDLPEFCVILLAKVLSCECCRVAFEECQDSHF